VPKEPCSLMVQGSALKQMNIYVHVCIYTVYTIYILHILYFIKIAVSCAKRALKSDFSGQCFGINEYVRTYVYMKICINLYMYM